VALLGTENVTLEFGEDSIDAISRLADDINRRVENIGARRLQTVMEKLLEDVSFAATDMGGQTVKVDAALVHEKVGSLLGSHDLSRFIL
jgi:ATP-dependent HslUV protease ATP-binding subunit HslU